MIDCASVVQLCACVGVCACILGCGCGCRALWCGRTGGACPESVWHVVSRKQLHGRISWTCFGRMCRVLPARFGLHCCWAGAVSVMKHARGMHVLIFCLRGRLASPNQVTIPYTPKVLLRRRRLKYSRPMFWTNLKAASNASLTKPYNFVKTEL